MPFAITARQQTERGSGLAGNIFIEALGYQQTINSEPWIRPGIWMLTGVRCEVKTGPPYVGLVENEAMIVTTYDFIPVPKRKEKWYSMVYEAKDFNKIWKGM